MYILIFIMKKFEDLKVGLTNKSRTSVVELEEMLDWAKKYDPQWFHADPEAAKTSIFGEIISSGIYTAALWRKLDHEINGDIDFICGVAWKETRWPNALRAGDTIYASSEVIEKRDSKTHKDRGIITFRYGLHNQHNQLVFSCDSINLIRRHSPS